MTYKDQFERAREDAADHLYINVRARLALMQVAAKILKDSSRDIVRLPSIDQPAAGDYVTLVTKMTSDINAGATLLLQRASIFDHSEDLDERLKELTSKQESLIENRLTSVFSHPGIATARPKKAMLSMPSFLEGIEDLTDGLLLVAHENINLGANLSSLSVFSIVTPPQNPQERRDAERIEKLRVWVNNDQADNLNTVKKLANNDFTP